MLEYLSIDDLVICIDPIDLTGVFLECFAEGESFCLPGTFAVGGCFTMELVAERPDGLFERAGYGCIGLTIGQGDNIDRVHAVSLVYSSESRT